jgi:hypothetical protein
VSEFEINYKIVWGEIIRCEGYPHMKSGLCSIDCLGQLYIMLKDHIFIGILYIFLYV